MNNSIAGCQDVGKAYWYVPPKDSSSTAAKFIPIGAQYSGPDPSKFGLFQNNRGHGCYSGVYGEDDGLVTSDQLFGYKDGIHDATHQAVVDELDGLDLSRIRDRGVWLRPSFFVVKDARVATARDGVSTVTSGGVDGNYPGVWGLLLNSVVVGISTNNVDRWGPCGSKVISPGFPAEPRWRYGLYRSDGAESRNVEDRRRVHRSWLCYSRLAHVRVPDLRRSATHCYGPLRQFPGRARVYGDYRLHGGETAHHRG